MKPFNLEQAKAGKPVCTRDGREVRIICFDVKNEDFPIMALVYNSKDNFEFDCAYTKDGFCFIDRRKNDCNLMMKGEKKKGYVALFKPSIWSDSMAYASDVYESHEKLQSIVEDDDECLGIVEVEWED